MLEEKESLLHEMQSQEKEFKLQNQTAMEELSLVCSTNCSRAIVQGQLLTRDVYTDECVFMLPLGLAQLGLFFCFIIVADICQGPTGERGYRIKSQLEN